MSDDKKRINTKRKGDNFERQVAKIFQDWYGREVRRAPLSGMGVLKIDIVSDENFPFLIQCKKQESWRLESILSGKGELGRYIDELYEIKNYLFYNENKILLLVISRNYSNIYAVLDENELNKLTSHGFDVSALTYICFKYNGKNYYMFLLKDMLRNLKPFEVK